jgi:OPA family sugar phosphate sensor protein UhpC-like MFS transporter
MIETVLGFFRKSERAEPRDISDADVSREWRRRKWSVFLSITFGYGFYYICRLSFSVAKKPMADEGVFDAAQMGIIGSALFFAYALGKLTNGLLADRVNVRAFMATGLFVSAIANFALGFTTAFWVFLLLWGVNGWFQSFGAPSSVVSLSRWYNDEERGTIYGMWSSSHNIGEAITFILTAVVVSSFGWMWGFRAAGLACFAMCFVIWRFLYERPEVYGLPGVVDGDPSARRGSEMTKKQWAVFGNPSVWILAFASAFFYVTRYAINSWGIFFLEAEKGYTTLEASSIISVNAIAGIVGTFFSGFLSDRFFAGRRNIPALIFGIIYALATALFVLGPANPLVDTASMVLFGLALGVLLVYLGGLMAVDICSKEVAGTALGIVGVASYLGAGIQDVVSGYLIEGGAAIVDGQKVYDFSAVGSVWIGSAIVSLVLASLVWRTKADGSKLK